MKKIKHIPKGIYYFGTFIKYIFDILERYFLWVHVVHKGVPFDTAQTN